MRISRPLALLRNATQLRRCLVSLRHLRLRTKLIIAFCSIFLVLVSGYLWWYIPHRPSALVGQAMLKSFQQSSASFNLRTSGSSSLVIEGQIDADGDTSFNVDKDGQHINLQTVGGLTYLKGGDGQWLAMPTSMAGSTLPITGATIQPDGLERANRKQLETLYLKHPFIVVNAVFKDQTVAGSLSNHYQVAINKHQLRVFLQAVQRDMPKLTLQNDQINSILNASIIGRPVEVWVDAHSGLVRQVAFAGDDSETSLTFTSYGQTGDITKPQAAKDLMTSLQR